MALTKHDIVEKVYNQLGFPKNQSVEIVEFVSGSRILSSRKSPA